MKLIRVSAIAAIVLASILPIQADAAIKYGPDAAYRRGAPGEPCFFSRHAIEYDQGAGGVVEVYRSHFWVYVSDPSASLDYKHSIGEWDNWTNPKLWSTPDYPLPLSSSNTPTWIYEFYGWAGHSYGGVWDWNAGSPGWVRWKDRAGSDTVWMAGWDTRLNANWAWAHDPIVQVC